jgi:dolichyl-diphosphooligosaccharide--protein glycosyltransferase
VPNVGIFRKGFWQIVAICFAVFLFSAGLRLMEYPRWDQSGFKVDGEWLLATHDAYFWVAGAEDENPIAEPMPMAVLLDLLSRIFPIPLANLAFWASILLAALVAIPLALWCYFLGAPYAALIVPILGARSAGSWQYGSKRACAARGAWAAVTLAIKKSASFPRS